MRLPLAVRLLLWIGSATLAAIIASAAAWHARLNTLGGERGFSWFEAYAKLSAMYAIPASLAYLGGLAALLLMPVLYRRALEKSTNDTWAFVVAIAAGALLGLVLNLIFSSNQGVSG